MTAVVQGKYTNAQIDAWVRGLLAIAWADGHFDPEEQEFIAELTQELAPNCDLCPLEPITPQELAATLGHDQQTAENFLRTAVMMALVNGIYSVEESKIIYQFIEALGLKIEALKSLEHTLYDPNKHELEAEDDFVDEAIAQESQLTSLPHPHPDALNPVRDWLDGMEVQDSRLARFLCKTIPPQCPFERDVVLFGKKIIHIPPMCKLNPLYDQLVGLRFRALSYLADECGEDVTPYI